MSNKRFVPIADIDGYIRALKTEGFYSPYEIECIRQRHINALEAQNKPEIVIPPKRTMDYVKNVASKDDVYLKMKVGKNGVKAQVIAPWSEYLDWIAKHGTRNIPDLVVIRCHALNGAPRSWCEMMYKLMLRSRKLRGL
jgi:hypothetical protein